MKIKSKINKYKLVKNNSKNLIKKNKNFENLINGL